MSNIGAGDLSFSQTNGTLSARFGRSATVSAVGRDSTDQRVVLLSGHGCMPWSSSGRMLDEVRGTAVNRQLKIRDYPGSQVAYGETVAGRMGAQHDWCVGRLSTSSHDDFHPSARTYGLVQLNQQTLKKTTRLQFWSRYPSGGLIYGRIDGFDEPVSFSVKGYGTVQLSSTYRVYRTNSSGSAVSGRFSRPGDSGALVCNRIGYAVGLVVSSNATYSWVLPIHPVHQALRSLGFRFFT